MKHIAIIGTILVLLILTAGCLDDLSSTLPPCCDGTCDGVKTSVITQSRAYFAHESIWIYYAIDSDGYLYSGAKDIPPTFFNHNVTFSYEMVNGHRHITGIIEDHDVKKPIGCCRCEVQKYSYNTEWSRVEDHWETANHTIMMWNETPDNLEFITPSDGGYGYGFSDEYWKQYCLKNPNDCFVGQAGGTVVRAEVLRV